MPRRVFLSDLQMQVLLLTAEGKGRKTIGGELGLTAVRVDKIRDVIKGKLHLAKGKDAADMVAAAREQGVID